jgi:hypothetical protein
MVWRTGAEVKLIPVLYVPTGAAALREQPELVPNLWPLNVDEYRCHTTRLYLPSMKATERAKARWARNKRRPAFKKIAGAAYWLDGDTKPRIPKGGPKRKR